MDMHIAMNDLYETRIPTVRWLAYDLAGNAGWITWVVCAILCIKQGLALLMPIGVCEPISARIGRIEVI